MFPRLLGRFAAAAPVTIATTTTRAIPTACSIHTSHVNSKGHSKWQNIQHIKADVDAARSLKIKQQMGRIRLAITGEC